MMEGKTPERNARYRDWYAKNKERIAKERRERYKGNSEYREKQIANSRYYYWTKVRSNQVLQPVDVSKVKIEVNKEIKVHISNPQDARYGTDVTVPVLDAGELGALMGRTAQTIRLWERRGVTSKAMWRDIKGYRLYTLDQVYAFLENKHLLEMPTRDFENSLFARKIKDALELMPDGIKVEPMYQVRVTGICPVCNTLEDSTMPNYKADAFRCQRCGMALKDKKVEQ